MKELKHLTRFLLLIACASLLIGTASACYNDCLSPGYWKNHPDEWPVEIITIGGTEYLKGDADTEGTAIYFMSQPVKGDKTITMFKALVAAKLNEANGCEVPDCIQGCIQEADSWMTCYGPVGSCVKANVCAWKEGEPLYECLDAYNNGKY